MTSTATPLVSGALVLDFLRSHPLTVAVHLLGLGIALRVLVTRRSPQSLMAWVLGLLVMPWVAVPFFLLFGARKLPRKVRGKHAPLLPPGGHAGLPDTHPAANVPRVLRTEGVPGVRSGNAFELLGTGERAYEALHAEIAAARTSIDLTIFIVGDDEVGWSVVHALADRARAGVRVRLLVDAVGSRPIRRRASEELRAAGGELRTFMPLLHAPLKGRTNLRSHRKVGVFDGRRVFMGGMNLALEYMGPTPRADRWRDLACILAGPVASDAGQLFAADWAFAGGAEGLPPTVLPPDAGEAVLQLVPSGPEMKTDTFYDALLTALASARTHVACVTPYYVPDDVVQHAFVLCGRRGVRTQLVMPARSNHSLADNARRGLLAELSEAGVELLWYDRMVHGKAMVVDDTVAYLGSPNLDMRSFFLNYEDALFLYSPAEVAAVRGWIASLADQCSTVHGPPSRRWWMIEDFARLMAPEL